MHQTGNLDDGYLGSGKILRHAIAKYGSENFKRDILFVFDNEQEMREKEKEIVTEEFVELETNYNLNVGGKGNFSHINKTGLNGSRKGVERRLELLNDLAWRASWNVQRLKGIQSMSSEAKAEFQRKRVQTIREGKGFATFTGRTHKPESIAKMKESKIGKCSGQNNSQHGSFWITNGSVNIKVKDIDSIPDGFYKGRVMKK